MSVLQEFEHLEFGKIRVIEQDGEPWFVAADVCRALELSNTAVSLERLDEDEKYKFNLGLSGGDTWCVNEPGLYTLVLGSRKPEAKAFKRWITHDVLPNLRREGTYSILPAASPINQRVLTTDDYLRAALIVSNCRNERLPYVLGFLEKGGWEIPKIRTAEFPAQAVSRVINDAIQECGFTITQICNLTGIDKVQIGRYRSGRGNPRKERAEYIVRVLSEATTRAQK